MSDRPGGTPNPADFFGWLTQMMNLPATAASAMSPNAMPGNDPMAIWKNMTEKNQEIWSKYLQQMVGTGDFAQTMGRSSSNAASYRALIRQAAKPYLEAANIPSSDDLARVAEQIVMLDAKIDTVNDRLGESFEAVPAVLNRMVSLLETLANRVGLVEDKIEKLSQQGPASVTIRLSAMEAQLGRLESQLNQLAPEPEVALRKVSATHAPTAEAQASLEAMVGERRLEDLTEAPTPEAQASLEVGAEADSPKPRASNGVKKSKKASSAD